MDPRNNATFGRSSSMPLLPQDLAQELELETERRQALGSTLWEIENSPEYQRLFPSGSESQNARSHGVGIHLGDPESSEQESSESLSSPSSDETVKPSITQRNRNSASCSGSSTHGSPYSAGRVVPHYAAGYQNYQDNTPSNLSPHAPGFQSSVRPINNALSKSSSEPLLGYQLNLRRRQSLAYSNQSPSSPREQPYNSSAQCHGYHQDGDTTDRMGSTQGLYKSPSNMHQRSASLRNSSIPSMPSRLGPGHFTDDLGSDTSGLVSSPQNASQSQRRSFTPAYGQPARVTNPVSTPRKSQPPSTWNTPTCYSHDPNDPFVDPRPAFPPATPKPTSSRPTAQLPATPSQQQSFPQFTRPANTPAPLPTPTIPTTRLSQMPQNRHLLDSRKPIRESWIRREAAKIAALTTAHMQAKSLYIAQPTPANYESLRRVQKALITATDLDARTEERRNMFMPAGTRALRTGPGSELVDGFAGGVGGVGGAEGRLLGGHMAFLERVCTEGGMGGGIGERFEERLVEGMSVQEKRAVRRHFVDVIRGATERRRRG